MFYYTKFYAFEILDGGDNMFMVDGLIATSLKNAKHICRMIEDRRLQEKRKAKTEIWYCCFSSAA